MSKEPRSKKEGRGKDGSHFNPRKPREARGCPEVLALYPSTPEPIPWGNSRECPHGNFRFPRSGRLYDSFRGAPPTRKYSYVPFTRRVRRVSPSRSRTPVPRIRLIAHRLFLSRWSTHACWNVEAFVRRLRHTRKYTRAGCGCISMYFYARVIAPTVYFYPTRVICNEPPSDRAERRGSRGIDTVLPSAVRGKKDRSIESAESMWRDICEARRIRSILLETRPSVFQCSENVAGKW